MKPCSSFPCVLILCVVAVVQTARTRRQLVGGDMSCPPGFHQLQSGNCYRHFTSLSTWTEAQTFCRSVNSDVLTIDDAAENQAVTNWINSKAFPDKNVWLGGHDMYGFWSWGQNGGWGWASLQWAPLTYTSWAPGQPDIPPNQTDGSFRCMLSMVKGQWKPTPCDNRHAFVCEFQ